MLQIYDIIGEREKKNVMIKIISWYIIKLNTLLSLNSALIKTNIFSLWTYIPKYCFKNSLSFRHKTFYDLLDIWRSKIFCNTDTALTTQSI